MTESEASTLTTTLTEPGKDDREVSAIFAIVAALKPLKEDEVRNVLEYVLRRFGAGPLPVYATSPTPSSVPQTAPPAHSGSGAVKDVRTLREDKAPKSANEMAALVAYYVSELAPATERKPEINKTDVERYFKTAGFRLTANAGQTLVNAKNAGYLDAGSDVGYYKLNPVGYNLVVHRLGSGDGGNRSIRSPKKSVSRKR
ncbi:MAG: hypothetical protein WBD25_15300 [Terriglobales bacterium]|jgi:hypothetical protein